MMDRYCINFEEIENLYIAELKDFLDKIKGKEIEKLKIQDLIFFNNLPIRTGNGVYIFKFETDYIYVGNCVARSFDERIPSHFDIRENGWFNSLLFTINKKKFNKKEKTNQDLAAKLVIKNCNIILINFEDYNKRQIHDLEYILKIILKPLNSFKTRKIKNLMQRVYEFEK